jgi:hypothetical protein
VLILKPLPTRVTAEWMAQQWRDGRRTKSKIGAYPAMSLSDAREIFKRDFSGVICERPRDGCAAKQSNELTALRLPRRREVGLRSGRQVRAPSRTKIDAHIEFCGLQDRQIGGPFTLEYPASIVADLPVDLGNAGAIAHQAARNHKLAYFVNCWDLQSRCRFEHYRDQLAASSATSDR